MKLLKGIGSLFVKLWRWIKETAWVQPLLIVGAIFAVIFSIPSFTSWIQSLSNETTNAYFTSCKISLNKKNVGDQSDADAFTSYLKDNSYFGKSVSEVENKKSEWKDAYGEKFVVAYVSKTCSECTAFQPALQLLEEQWNDTYIDNSPTKKDFKLYTIFADETSDIDDADDNTLNQYTAFERYLNDNINFFVAAGQRFENDEITPYTKNAGLTKSDKFGAFGQAAADSLKKFPVPTVLLVDFTEEAFKAGRPGVSEVLFGVSGSSKFEKASLLLNMWNHFEGETAGNETARSNIFSDKYIK